MTVSEPARNAGFGTSASDKPPFLESVLSDFKGLRRHFRVSRIAHIGLNTIYICYKLAILHPQTRRRADRRRRRSSGPRAPMGSSRQAKFLGDCLRHVG
jgi:hypothetical protein